MVEKLSIRQHTGRGTDKERQEKKRRGKGMASQRMLAIISGVQARLRLQVRSSGRKGMSQKSLLHNI